MQIVAPLEIEDYVIQTAEFMSPPRWHIGHMSWFFETVLQAPPAGLQGLFGRLSLLLQLLLRRLWWRALSAPSVEPSRVRLSGIRSLIAITSMNRCCGFLDSLDEQPNAKPSYNWSGWALSTRCSTRSFWLRHQASALRSVRRSHPAGACYIGENRGNGRH